MRFNFTVLVGLFLIWTGEAGSAERALYLLSELSESKRQEYGAELPAEYAGIWFVRSQHPLPSGAVELERPADTVCIASGPWSAYIRIHVADNLDEKTTWRLTETGWTLKIKGQLYAYVVRPYINLATGRLLRFQRTGKVRTLAVLDLESLRKTLDERSVSFTLNSSGQLAIAEDDLIRVLREAQLKFNEIGIAASGEASDLRRCK